MRRSYRDAAAALALSGMAFYAALLPWHLTSQFAAQLFGAEFGEALSLICKSGAGLVRSDAPSDQNPLAPEAPAVTCPICKGLAGFQFAVVAAALVGLLAPHGKLPAAEALIDAVADAAIPVPRSRGPPLPA